jgi:hypothetical protein
MKKLMMGLLALNLMSSMSFAEDKTTKEGTKEKCACSQECKDNCNKGKTENCDCTDCECKTSGKCH